MIRVLIAASRSWLGVGRLPSTLGRAGATVSLLDPGGTPASASSWVAEHFAEPGGDLAIVRRLGELSDDYEQVIVADDPLIWALLQADDPAAVAALPARVEELRQLADKTLFPAAARAAGINVPASYVAHAPEQVAEIAEQLAGDVILKGRFGSGGSAVRHARSPKQAVAVAKPLGLPVLVEAHVLGELTLMPCLFDEGRLVAAFAAHKARTLGRRGPSSLLEMRIVDAELVRAATAVGATFGLSGFASLDLIRDSEGRAHVLEVNARPVPALHVGRSLGVDMAEAFVRAVLGDSPRAPSFGMGSGTLPVFPLELQRLRRQHGRFSGTLRWAVQPGAFKDVPWDDAGLLRYYLSKAG